MKDWLKRFFSTSNEINENVVVGCLLIIVVLVSTFVSVPADKYYTIAILAASFFGLGALKK